MLSAYGDVRSSRSLCSTIDGPLHDEPGTQMSILSSPFFHENKRYVRLRRVPIAKSPSRHINITTLSHMHQASIQCHPMRRQRKAKDIIRGSRAQNLKVHHAMPNAEMLSYRIVDLGKLRRNNT